MEHPAHVTCLTLRKPAFGRLTVLIARMHFEGLFEFSFQDACRFCPYLFFCCCFFVTAVSICKPIVCISICSFWLSSGWDPELQIDRILRISLSLLLSHRGWQFSVGFCAWLSRQSTGFCGSHPYSGEPTHCCGAPGLFLKFTPDLSSLIGSLKRLSFFNFEFPIDPFYIAAKIWRAWFRHKLTSFKVRIYGVKGL